RYLAHEVKIDCFPKVIQKPLDEKFLGSIFGGHRLDFPIAFEAKVALVPHGDMRRRQLLDSLIDRMGPWHVSKGEEARQRGQIRSTLEAIHHQQGLHLRSEGEMIWCPAVVEGFDAEPITSQQQALFRRIPDREAEHSAKPSDGRVAELLIEMHETFGVRGC